MVYRGSALIESGIPGHDGRQIDEVVYITRRAFMEITPDRNKFYVVTEDVAPEILGALAQGSASGKTKFTAAYFPWGTDAVKYILTTDDAAPSWPNIGDELPDDTVAFTSAADITATAEQALTLFAVSEAGKIIGAWQKVLVTDDIKA